MNMEVKEVIKILKKGGIGVLPTDTLYGLVGSAFSPKAVARIYKVRKRNLKNPLIVLISGFSDFGKFDIKLSKRIILFLKKIWPGPVSVILPCPSEKFFYLHRGTRTLALRLPATRWLRAFLKKTGPLVAPSANIEGRPPALTIGQAKKYFGNKIDFYFSVRGGSAFGGDKNVLKRTPSVLIEIKR